MSFKWQQGDASGKDHCAECGGLLTAQDRRPRSIAMRLQHPVSRLYICRECGCRNLVGRVEAKPQPPTVVGETGDGSRHQLSKAERLRQIRHRIERNTRAYVKLRELIDSDRRLLKSLSERHR